MRARYPIWLVLPGEDGPGKHKLESYSDNPDYGPDEGMLLIPLTVLGHDKELVVCDTDERFRGGSFPPLAYLESSDNDHLHWFECSYNCDHLQEIVSDYVKTDAGWWLVSKLNGGCEIWVHEDDVPIDNHPKFDDGISHRRPPKDLDYP